MSGARESKWQGWQMLAFDLETTGVDTVNDRIVTAAAVRIEPGSRPATTRYVVDPGVDIPDEAAAVHGYTRDRAAAEATHETGQMLFELAGALALAMGRGIPVVTFNGSFDLTMFEVECMRHDVATLTDRLGLGKVGPVVDVHVLDKTADPYRKGSRKLQDVCGVYGVRHTGAHDAAGDALAAARLWPRVMTSKAGRRVFGESLTLDQLHVMQARARREQMAGLRAYFDRKGIEHDGCDGGWPLQDRLRELVVAGGVSR